MMNITLSFWAFDAVYLTDARQCITSKYIARQDVIMAKKSISLRMDEEKIKKLDAIAYSQDRSRSYIIEEAVEAYVSYKDEKEANIRKAITEMDRGEGIPHEEMKEFFEELRERAYANTVALLYDNPLMGRKSERTPSRELVIPRTNYIVIYRVMETELEILSVYHAKQNWKR